MKQKRGSHVGVVLSFVVFVTFLIFIFTTLQPLTKTTQKREILLDYLKEKLTDEISSDLIKITISGAGTGEQILRVNAPQGECFNGYSIVGKTQNGKSLMGKIFECNAYVKAPLNPNLIYVFLSKENISIGEPASISDFEEVKISLYQKKKYIFKSKALEFIERYNKEYFILRDELEIPKGSEFGFAFEDSQGKVFKTNEQDVQTDVFVDQIPTEYVNKSGDIMGGFVSFKVW